MTALKDYTPWSMMRDILSKPRYRHMTAYELPCKGWVEVD
jgi:hypothetical protein